MSEAVSLQSQSITKKEIIMGILLAGTSAGAILVHTFANVPMRFVVPFVSLPAVSVLVGIVFLYRKQHAKLHVFAHRLYYGGLGGLIATLFYDGIRPLLEIIFQFSYESYRAMAIFGKLITGLPEAHWLSLTSGWTYHFCNGITLGMMFALIRPKGGPIAGLVWSLILQGMMMVTYPSFIQARIADPGFLTTSLVGHSLWGVVLGLYLRYWKPNVQTSLKTN